MINYKDYLQLASTNQILSTSGLTNPRSIGTPVDLTFKFILKYDSEKLDRMAEVFLSQIRANHTISNGIDRSIALPFNERNDCIKNSFKYSYFKTMYNIKMLYENGFNYVGSVPSNSYVFYGHKMLYYTFLDNNIFNPSRSVDSNVYLTRVLDLDFSIFDNIEQESVYIESINNMYPGGIYNVNYERILSSFNDIPEIQVSLLGERNDIPMESSVNPLGNTALTKGTKPLIGSAMEDSVATITCTESVTDHVSKFWNTANFISILDLPEQFQSVSSGSPYTYVTFGDINSSVLFAEVEAITGITNRGFYSQYGRNVQLPSSGGTKFSGNGSNNNNPSNSGSNESNDSSNSNENRNRNKRNIKKSSNRSEQSKNNISKSVNSDLKGIVKQFSTTIGRVLTDIEAKQILTSTASTILKHQLAQNRVKQLIEDLKKTKYVRSSKTADLSLGFANVQNSNEVTTFE